jgi:aspartate 1-decarboxylase
MLRHLMKSKIHRATVTDADLNYVGSITIDRDLLDAADLMPNEKVQVVNNNNGARFETYIFEGERGSRQICLNGAAARLAHPGDIVIIISYGVYDQKEALEHRPRVVLVDAENRVSSILSEEVQVS